jgi:hypothetical protein
VDAISWDQTFFPHPMKNTVAIAGLAVVVTLAADFAAAVPFRLSLVLSVYVCLSLLAIAARDYDERGRRSGLVGSRTRSRRHVFKYSPTRARRAVVGLRLSLSPRRNSPSTVPEIPPPSAW